MPNEPDAERLGIAALIEKWQDSLNRMATNRPIRELDRTPAYQMLRENTRELFEAWLHEHQRMASVAARAEAGEELAEALKGCNGALIGAVEALFALGYVATTDTLGKYIRGAEQALRKWEGAADE